MTKDRTTNRRQGTDENGKTTCAAAVKTARFPLWRDTMNGRGKIYLGSVLLEPNRHKPGRRPTVRVSEWAARFAADGFDGIELWENHAALCPSEELERLGSLPLPVAVFNSYCGFEDAGEADRRRAAELTKRLRASGVKFNVGKDAALRDIYLKNAREWAGWFPEGVKLLCECHPGTIVETPEPAAAFFAELPSDRFEIIVHPFRELDVLREWFRRFGSRIAHSHVQLREEGKKGFLRLDRNPGFVKETLKIVREEGYTGSFTLEFAEGTNAPEERIEDLYQNALRDLRVLKENWG